MFFTNKVSTVMFERLAGSSIIKKKTSKLVEGQGREKRVHFPYSTQLGSYSFSPKFRGRIKMVGAPSFKKKQRIYNMYWSGKIKVRDHCLVTRPGWSR